MNFLTVDDPQDGFRYCMFFDVGMMSGDFEPHVSIHIRSAYRKKISFSSRQKVRLGTLIDRVLGIKKPGKAKKRRKK